MYIIQSGAVEVPKMRQGHKLVLTLLDKGQFFGEVALVDNKLHSATVTAVTRTRLLSLSRHTFLQRIAYNPDVVLRVLRALSRRIDRMTETIRSLIGSDEALRQKVFSSNDDFPVMSSTLGDSGIQTAKGPAEGSQSSDDHHLQVSVKFFSTALNIED